MVRLQETPGDADLSLEFDAWLVDPVNKAAWADTQRMMRAVSYTAPRDMEDWGPFLKRLREEGGEDGRAVRPDMRSRRSQIGAPRPPRHSRAERPVRRRVFGYMAAAIASLIVAVVVGPDFMARLSADHATATAETQVMTMTDDSVINLAPGSAIDVTDTPTERGIRLLSGEVFVEVTPDPDRPFRVETDDIRITVLGTAFNVSQSDDGAAVDVAHGSVRVDSADGATSFAEALTAGQFVRVSHAGQIDLGQVPVSQVGAWRQDRLVAQDETVRTVVDRLRRYYSGVILIADPSLSDQPVTGVYDLRNPEGALRGIARSQNADVHAVTPWLLVVSRF